MVVKDIIPSDKKAFNEIVTHPLQSYEWGEFREQLGTRVRRMGFFENKKLVDGLSMTLHPIPRTSWNIGYVPKGKLPTKEIIEELQEIGKQEKCVFIQLEPNVIKPQDPNNKLQKDWDLEFGSWNLKQAAHPLFTKYTFILDLTPTEEELLKNMHQKTRYNIRIAEKKGVIVKEDNSPESFTEYLKLTHDTTKRQRFFAHTQNYHRKMWDSLGALNTKYEILNTANDLRAHLFTATYEQQTLVTWIVFVFKDTLYYPYGASSNEHREVMASNLMMWEVIKWGKKKGIKKFDMWGSLGPDADASDPWYGFHRFKQGYNPVLTEFLGSYDLVLDPKMYLLYKIADKIRWKLLALKK